MYTRHLNTMFPVFLGVLLALLVINVPPALPVFPEDCGLSLSPSAETGSLGGKDTTIESWPWTAMLFIDRGHGHFPECSGSLISQRHVLTAAQCVWNNTQEIFFAPSQVIVRLGVQNWRRGDDGSSPVDAWVKSIQPHESYNPVENKNDIAILTLESPVDFGARVRSVCLPYKAIRTRDLSGSLGVLTGWGITDIGDLQADGLQAVTLPVVSNKECKEFYQDLLPTFSETYLCAGNSSYDSCRGTSGGPLVVAGQERRFFQIGILSVGRSDCGDTEAPSVYTRVSEFVDWIASKVASP